jgi:polyisoprenyl-teichoic acid--peptidoglycan teichoic acid transferase
MSDEIISPRHSGKHRIFLLGNIALAMLTIFSGSGLLYANWKLNNRKVVTIDMVDQNSSNFNLPIGDLKAKNYLITGSDNNTCIAKDSEYAGGFGIRSSFGERSDSIMVIRVNPIDNQAAVLSFPRDMWVTQAGSTRHGRINSNFDKKNPNRLIRTIKENFGISIDHYVNVDFCAFKEVIDAVGGVRVPFVNKSRDTHTGFRVMNRNVCYTFQGDHALAYMRSRHFQWFDPALKQWRTDQSSDWGRIARQQDFIRRLVKKALEKAGSNPRVATGILNAALKNVITDDRLNAITVLQLGQAMKNFDANTMGSYTMPGLGRFINNLSVIVPDLESDFSLQILAVFQGKASLSTTLKKTSITSSPSEFTELTAVIATTSAVRLSVSKPLATTTTSPSTTSTTTTTTIPSLVIEQNTRGIVPADDPNCQF